MASINLLVDKGALPGPFRTLSLRSQLMSQRVRKQSCGLLTKDLILGSFAQSGHRCSVVGDDGARGRFSFVRQRQHTGSRYHSVLGTLPNERLRSSEWNSRINSRTRVGLDAVVVKRASGTSE